MADSVIPFLGQAQLNAAHAGFTVNNVDDLGSAVDVTFTGNVTAAQFSPGDFEIDTGAGFVAGTQVVTQTSADTVRFANPIFWAGLGGDDWRMLSGPANVQIPQTGTIP